MVVVPIPTIETSPPDVTVATAVLLLVNVNAPLGLLLVGTVMLNDASPNIFVGMVSAPNTVTIPLTSSTPVTLWLA